MVTSDLFFPHIAALCVALGHPTTTTFGAVIPAALIPALTAAPIARHISAKVAMGHLTHEERSSSSSS